MAQVDWQKAIYDKFTADTGAGTIYADLVTNGGGFYFVQAPDDASLPFGVWTAITDVPDGYFSDSDLNATFQVDIWSSANKEGNTPTALVAINDKLIALFDRVELTSVTNHTNVQTWVTDRGVPVREEDAYRITSQWRIFGTSS